MIRFLCPGCGATYTVDDSKGGKTGKCPKCQSQFTIPMPEVAAAPPVPAPAPAPASASSNEPVEIAPCPGCQARLSVAPSDLGIDVECPYCKTVYKAAKPGTGPSAPVPPPAPPRVSQLERAGGRDRRDDDAEEEARPSRRRRRDEDDELEERPSRRRRRDEDEEEDERPSRRRRRDEDDDDEDERPRRKRRGGRTADAEAAVSVPAIFLIILGGLGVLVGVANIFSVATGMNFGPAQVGAAEKAGQYVGAFVSLIWAVVVLLGGIKMKSLSGRGSAMTGAIIAMIPCNPCCLLGLPIGIWALTVLNREDVKRAFG